LADMRAGRYWIWDLDDVVQKQMTALGVHLVKAPLWDAAALYAAGKVDGFSTVPGAAVAFQWSAQARHATPLDYSVLTGCAMMNQRVLAELSPAARHAIAKASAKLQTHFNDLTATQDEALLEQLFARQGLAVDRPSPRFRAEFGAAVDEMHRKLGAELVPPALLQEARQILADYRAHR
ncbi:MAG: TRAP transporter substrate-binding protein DctP, partial [Polyangia bacterium]